MTPGEKLRETSIKARPDNCCKKQPMKSSDRVESYLLCDSDCLWQKLDLVIVNILLDEKINEPRR